MQYAGNRRAGMRSSFSSIELRCLRPFCGVKKIGNIKKKKSWRQFEIAQPTTKVQASKITMTKDHGSTTCIYIEYLKYTSKPRESNALFSGRMLSLSGHTRVDCIMLILRMK